jgi:hypothetical protein
LFSVALFRPSKPHLPPPLPPPPILAVRAPVLALAATVAAAGLRAAPPTPVSPVNVFYPGLGGVMVFRIPSLVATPAGTLVALAEARSCTDSDCCQKQVPPARRRTAGGVGLPHATRIVPSRRRWWRAAAWTVAPRGVP